MAEGDGVLKWVRQPTGYHQEVDEAAQGNSSLRVLEQGVAALMDKRRLQELPDLGPFLGPALKFRHVGGVTVDPHLPRTPAAKLVNIEVAGGLESQLHDEPAQEILDLQGQLIHELEDGLAAALELGIARQTNRNVELELLLSPLDNRQVAAPVQAQRQVLASRVVGS
jgi:hypothetical protein